MRYFVISVEVLGPQIPLRLIACLKDIDELGWRTLQTNFLSSWQKPIEGFSKDALLTAGNAVIPDLNLLVLGSAAISLRTLCYVLISIWLEFPSHCISSISYCICRAPVQFGVFLHFLG